MFTTDLFKIQEAYNYQQNVDKSFKTIMENFKDSDIPDKESKESIKIVKNIKSSDDVKNFVDEHKDTISSIEIHYINNGSDEEKSGWEKIKSFLGKCFESGWSFIKEHWGILLKIVLMIVLWNYKEEIAKWIFDKITQSEDLKDPLVGAAAAGLATKNPVVALGAWSGLQSQSAINTIRKDPNSNYNIDGGSHRYEIPYAGGIPSWHNIGL